MLNNGQKRTLSLMKALRYKGRFRCWIDECFTTVTSLIILLT